VVSDRNDIDLSHSRQDHVEVLLRVCESVRGAGGRAWLVGGSVRDSASGLATQDLDLEVFGLTAEALREALETDFALDLVGQSFGIIKLQGVPIDVGLPRRESKIGQGHRGFEIHSDPHLSVRDAAARRDFTLNAIYLDPLTGHIEDPFDGIGDLQRGILRHTSSAFDEDPLRVLRGMQLAARFDLDVAPETVEVCRHIGLEGLATERIFGEWTKLVELGIRPSRGLSFLADCGWIRFFPELAALPGCPQDPRWHPEGDVWQHTLHCMDAFAAERLGDPSEDLVVGLAVLCHDFGKPATTTDHGGKVRALHHEREGVELTRSFLARMTNQRRLVDEVVKLVAEHMRPAALYAAGASDAAVRRLAARVGRLDRLVRVARADAFGRPPLDDTAFLAGDWLLQRARAMDIESAAPTRIVLGRHLMALGEHPGPHFNEILTRCYDAQLEGEFETVEEGIAFARRLLS